MRLRIFEIRTIDPCCRNVGMVKLNHIQSAPSHHEYDPARRTLRDRIVEKISEPMQLSLLDFIRSLGSNYPVAATTQNETKLNDQKHYPLRGMPIQIEPDFDAPMTDMWAALSE
jgi:hypothetical protein